MVDTVLELSAPARLPQVRALRHAADAFLRSTVDEETRFQMLLVISELCTNAVEALHNPSAELVLRVRDSEDSTVIEVEDLGPGFASAIHQPAPDDDHERGRGLQVVRTLVEEINVDRAYGKTTVRCVVSKRRAI